MRKWALAGVGILSIGIALVAMRRPARVLPPVLVVVEAPSEKDLDAHLQRLGIDDSIDEPSEERAMSLALASLPSKERAELNDSLHELVFSGAGSAQPMSTNTEGADASLQRVYTSVAPTLHAARTVATRSHRSKERNFAAIVAAACPVSNEVECVSLWGNEKGANIERARFLAGPVGDAVVVATKDGPSAEKLAGDIMAAERTHIALAFTEHTIDAHLLPSALEIASLARLAENTLKGHGTPEQRDLLHLLTLPIVKAAPWLQLSPNAVIIVPKVSSRASLPAFVAEARTLTRDHSKEIHTPGQL